MSGHAKKNRTSSTIDVGGQERKGSGSMAKEQTIISYFSSEKKAQEALQALTNSGLSDGHIRSVSRFGRTNDQTQDDPVSRAETLTGLTLYSMNTSKDVDASTRVLLGADPSVSGYSTSGNELSGGPLYSLVLFAPPERVEEAVGIIKQNGGDT